MTKPKTRVAQAVVAVTAAVLLGTAVQASSGEQSAEAASASSAGGSTAPDVVPAERVALCDLRPATIRGLRAGLPDAGSPESLRDAIWLLEERVEQWRGGSEGVARADAPVRMAADIEGAWRAALASHDAGDAAGSRAALARSEALIDQLGRQVKSSPIPGCS